MRFVDRLDDHAVHFNLLDDVNDITPGGLPSQQGTCQDNDVKDVLHCLCAQEYGLLLDRLNRKLAQPVLREIDSRRRIDILQIFAAQRAVAHLLIQLSIRLRMIEDRRPVGQVNVLI